MRAAFSVIAIFCLFAFVAKPAHAIIFLPAIILIPIAKIVALIIGGFSFPALGIGALWSKLFRKSLQRTLLIIACALLILGSLIALVLKIYNPERPLF